MRRVSFRIVIGIVGFFALGGCDSILGNREHEVAPEGGLPPDGSGSSSGSVGGADSGASRGRDAASDAPSDAAVPDSATGCVDASCVPCTPPGLTRSCGGAATCNAGAIETCQNDGTWSACSLGPQGACTAGTGYPCSTCSTISAWIPGSQTCSASCSLAGVMCNALSPGSDPFASSDTWWGHDCGSQNGVAWTVPAGTAAPCHPQYGPGLSLGAGSYSVQFTTSHSSASSVMVKVDVTVGSSEVAVQSNTLTAGQNWDPTLTFAVSTSCAQNVQFRVDYLGGGDLNVGPTTVTLH